MKAQYIDIADARYKRSMKNTLSQYLISFWTNELDSVCNKFQVHNQQSSPEDVDLAECRLENKNCSDFAKHTQAQSSKNSPWGEDLEIWKRYLSLLSVFKKRLVIRN